MRKKVYFFNLVPTTLPTFVAILTFVTILKILPQAKCLNNIVFTSKLDTEFQSCESALTRVQHQAL